MRRTHSLTIDPRQQDQLSALEQARSWCDARRRVRVEISDYEHIDGTITTDFCFVDEVDADDFRYDCVANRLLWRLA